MDIGTGIFLGCVFIGIVYLFIKTKDTWRWKRFFIWSLIIPIALFTVVCICDAVSDYFRDKPAVISSIDGISVGDKLSDTLFKNGSLSKIVTKDPSDKEESYMDESTYVASLNGKVIRIGHACNNNTTDYTDLNSIRCNNDSDDIINKFGQENVRILCTRNKNNVEKALNMRAYDVPKFNTRYILVSNSVVQFLIYETNAFKKYNTDNWKFCD